MMNSLTRTAALLVAALFLLACNPLKQGDKEMELGHYDTAIKDYRKVLESNSASSDMKAKANFHIAEAYRKSNRIHESLEYYRAAKNGGYKGEDIDFHYAQALETDGDYEQAATLYEAYAQKGADIHKRRVAKHEAENLHRIDEFKEPDPNVKLFNCDSLNTPDDEFAPHVFEGKLYFTSTRNTSNVYEGDGGGYEDLYFWEFAEDSDDNLMNGCAGKAEEFDKKINLKQVHESATAFSPDGRTLVFVRSNEKLKKKAETNFTNLFICRRAEDGGWSDPEMLPCSDLEHQDIFPAFSPDGKTLYFTSSRPGGEGSLDIWTCTQDASGQWSQVENAGDAINTPGHDMAPYVSKEGRLYFSSDGHVGLGRLDLFVANEHEGEMVVDNLGAPFNSPMDDLTIAYTAEDRGYFASNRDGGHGGDDIYFFTVEEPKNVKYFLEGLAFHIPLETDRERVSVGGAKVELYNASGEKVDEVTADSEGKFRFEMEVQPEAQYRLVATSAGYIEGKRQYTTGAKVDPSTLTQKDNEIVFSTDVELTKDAIVNNPPSSNPGEIDIEIYYEYDESFITDQGARKLDQLVKILQRHPEINIELGSHTDIRGSEGYNIRLSRRRAKAAVEYLVKKGVDEKRLEYKGYGKSQPKIPGEDLTEEQHRINRRTTVRFEGYTQDMLREDQDIKKELDKSDE